jgi:Carboxypeptidase regulatory-like domain
VLTKKPFPAAAVLLLGLTSGIAAAQSNSAEITHMGPDRQDHPIAANDRAYPADLSGSVVDLSDAVIAGASVQVRNPNGTAQRTTQTDRNGSFVISGLPAGNYRLVDLSYRIPISKPKKCWSP